MSGRVPISGPYRQIGLPDGESAPFYMIPFDRDGACTAPRTRAALIGGLTANPPSHVFLFSHGWNNDWPGAIKKYEEFIDGFARTRAAHPYRGQFRPLLIGVFWPSAVLVRKEDEAPVIAGGDQVDDTAVAEQQRELSTLAEYVEPSRRECFYELAQATDLDGADAEELAVLLAPIWGGTGDVGLEPDDLRSNPALRAEELLTVWRTAQFLESGPGDGAGEPVSVPAGPLAPPPGPFADGSAPAGPLAADVGPRAAGLLDKLDPRNIIRTTTVLLMKDRAGRVGARGVSALLEAVLSATAAPVHLVGHSYGCKVVMSALCSLPASARRVESVLLLQPAMSYLCFAQDVPGLGGPGGYRPGLARTRQPVLATYSQHDIPLTTFFHLAVRRASDLGEVQIAAVPPSRYSALGGFGPAEAGDVAHIPAALPGTVYNWPDEVRCLGVESSNVISGHSEINNPATWWMLRDQVEKSG